MISWNYAKTLLGKTITITDSQTEKSYTGKAKELHLSDNGTEFIMIALDNHYRYGVPLTRTIVNYIEEADVV